MKDKKLKEYLGFNPLLKIFKDEINKIPDTRQDSKVDYKLWDFVGSGFAMMYAQDESFLQFQKRMREETETGKCNLETVFKVSKLPESRSQQNRILDEMDFNTFRPVFRLFVNRLKAAGILKKFEFSNKKLLCALDGSEYFRSNKINCEYCLTTENKSGTSYSHKILQPVIIHPDLNFVIPLMPEEIKNTDGTKKQDCELNAAKRCIRKIKEDFPDLELIFTGDALYANQPFIELLRSEGYDFILNVKDEGHKTLMKNIDISENVKIKEEVDKNQTRKYQYLNEVSMNLNKETIFVNYLGLEIKEINKKGKETIKKKSWVTNFKITDDLVEFFASGGSSRWKIENECFNVLKNHGYNMEHNYGHGKNGLSFIYYLLMLLSHFMHQIFEMIDEVYQKLRKKLGSKKHFWERIRSCFALILFDSWDDVLAYALSPPKIKYKSGKLVPK